MLYTPISVSPTVFPSIFPLFLPLLCLSQSAVKLTVHVGEVDMYLTRFILRYVSTELAVSNGKITVYQSNRRGMSDDCRSLSSGICELMFSLLAIKFFFLQVMVVVLSPHN